MLRSLDHAKREMAPTTSDNDHPHYLQVAALVLTLYDHFLTFDREVDYIWSRAGWSLSSGLYIVTRYGGDLLAIGATFFSINTPQPPCNIGLKLVGAGSMAVILFAQVAMQLRVKTLYRRSMSKIINAIWVLEFVAAFGIAITMHFSIQINSLEPGFDYRQICSVKYFPAHAAAFWLPILIFEVFLFVLAFRVAWYNHRHLRNWRGAALIHVVLRDNINFFIVAFVAYLITGIVWFTVGDRYFLVTGQLSCSLTTIMSCRFILNLYQAYFRPLRASINSLHVHSIWATPAVIRPLDLDSRT